MLVDDDMHFMMKKIFFEDDSIPQNNTPQHGRIPTPPPYELPLVLYQSPNFIFSMVHKFLKAQSLLQGTSIFSSVSQPGLVSYSQLGSRGFVLVSTSQSNMAGVASGCLTRYPEFAWRGDEDVEKHWYLCEVV